LETLHELQTSTNVGAQGMPPQVVNRCQCNPRQIELNLINLDFDDEASL